jgi:crotonobetainyl-CoA:carnitine CoA-transferase CaiB-like acyl-CoA transferase
MAGPLHGIKVLDLSRVLAGPWASQTLADLGADVIKIERPGVGDDTRSWGPPYARDADGNATTESAYFLSANRGKKSVTIDIASAEGQTIVSALAEQSDIVVENFKVGALAKYGLDYETLSALNPRLIYCSITGFGQTGPYSALPGYDFMIQGMGGLMSISGHPDGQPGAGPMKTGVAVADLFSGMYAATAILAALHHRAATNAGTHIDIALLDCQVAMLANQAMNYLTTGEAPPRLGNAHPNIVPYEAFATADSHIILAVGNDAQFAAFCNAAGNPSLATDPRFATNPERVTHRAALIPVIAELMRARTTADWLASLSLAHVPAGPINTIEQVFADPHVAARGLRLDLAHPAAGTVPSVASPIRSTTPPTAPPTLGQHTASVLTDRLGLTPADLASLKTQRVI